MDTREISIPESFGFPPEILLNIYTYYPDTLIQHIPRRYREWILKHPHLQRYLILTYTSKSTRLTLMFLNSVHSLLLTSQLSLQLRFLRAQASFVAFHACTLADNRKRIRNGYIGFVYSLPSVDGQRVWIAYAPLRPIYEESVGTDLQLLTNQHTVSASFYIETIDPILKDLSADFVINNPNIQCHLVYRTRPLDVHLDGSRSHRRLHHRIRESIHQHRNTSKRKIEKHYRDRYLRYLAPRGHFILGTVQPTFAHAMLIRMLEGQSSGVDVPWLLPHIVRSPTPMSNYDLPVWLQVAAITYKPGASLFDNYSIIPIVKKFDNAVQLAPPNTVLEHLNSRTC